MSALNKRSETNLAGVHPDLVAVVRAAHADLVAAGKPGFVVTEGVRTKKRQRELYAQGRTAPGRIVTWTLNSAHIKSRRTGYGHAVDLFPGAWEPLSLFDDMAAAMFAAAKRLGVTIRWGADWDQDGKPRERGESDSPHFEIHQP